MILSKKLSKYKSIKHCFLGMEGGKSKGIYKSLNCGRGSSDTKVNVTKNLKIACRKIGSTHKKLILYQTMLINLMVHENRMVLNLLPKVQNLIDNQFHLYNL